MSQWPQVVLRIAREEGHPDPPQFERQIRLESANYADDVIHCERYSSAGAEGIAQIIRYWHPNVDPCNPEAALRYAVKLMLSYYHSYGTWAKALAAYNWGSGNVGGYITPQGVVVPPWDGRRDTLPKETQAYLSIILGDDWDKGGSPMPTPQTWPAVPDDVSRQRDDWSCSIRATYSAIWLLEEVAGIHYHSYLDVLDVLAPTYVNSVVGLQDASGKGLANAITFEFGYQAWAIPSVSLDEVRAELQKGNLVLIGGRSWGPAGHWALAVRAEPDGGIAIVNPAPGYRLGSTPIHDYIRDSWGKSSWSAVVVEPKVAEQPAPEPPQDTEARLKALEAEVAALKEQLAAANNLVGNAYNQDGTIRMALAGVVQSLLAIDNWLERNKP